MKKVLFVVATLLTFLGTTRKAQAQCTNPYDPDVWYYSYTGDMNRGGFLALGEGDYVYGTALTSSGFPNPVSTLPICTYGTIWDQNVGSALTLNNVTPACNGISYTMWSKSRSFRTMAQQGDTLLDHIEQSGLAWGSNPGDIDSPAIIDQIEAGSLLGTGSVANAEGKAHVIENVTGYCSGVVLQ